MQDVWSMFDWYVPTEQFRQLRSFWEVGATVWKEPGAQLEKGVQESRFAWSENSPEGHVVQLVSAESVAGAAWYCPGWQTVMAWHGAWPTVGLKYPATQAEHVRSDDVVAAVDSKNPAWQMVVLTQTPCVALLYVCPGMHDSQTRSDVAVGAVSCCCPRPHTDKDEQVRSDVMEGGALSNCVMILHTVRGLQTALDLLVQAVDVKLVIPSQTAQSMQMRCVLPVQAWLSHWEEVQLAPQPVQTASEVAVQFSSVTVVHAVQLKHVASVMYSLRFWLNVAGICHWLAEHVVSDEHTAFEVGVAGVETYCATSHVWVEAHVRSEVVVGGISSYAVELQTVTGKHWPFIDSLKVLKRIHGVQTRSVDTVGGIRTPEPAEQLWSAVQAEFPAIPLNVTFSWHCRHTLSLVTVGGMDSPKPTSQLVTGRQEVEFPILLYVNPSVQFAHIQFWAAVGIASGWVPAEHSVMGKQ
jgi:hypothetical protein